MGSRNRVGVIRVQPRSPLASLEVTNEETRPLQERQPTPTIKVQKRAIQWFQANFSRACKRGCMALKDFKRAAREIEVHSWSTARDEAVAFEYYPLARALPKTFLICSTPITLVQSHYKN
jgi:hypothetical protein